MFRWWRKLAPGRRPEQQEFAENTTQASAHHAEELDKFMHGLVPGDQHANAQMWYDDRGVMNIGDPRDDLCKQLAEGPLRHDHEAIARRLVTMRPSRKPGAWYKSSDVRTVGQQLCAEGGRWLMVLVAHRAQYLADPKWQAKAGARLAKFRRLQAVAEARGHVVMGSAGLLEGPLVRDLEYGWDGICGWQS